MSTHAAVWSEIQKLLPQGLSVIPVRDKDDDKGAAKTPFQGWKKYQEQLILEDELAYQINLYNTSAIAIICGKISGNLEVIDIDVKNNSGIDAKLFSAIKETYPNLWHILRIHKSPSGGYHILYRSITPIPGNKKLAGRITTEIEKQQYSEKFPNKNKPLNEVNFIETRGEGGYVLAPPSMGYSIFKDAIIPMITWEDRCSLIALCQSFNEIPQPIRKEPKPTKTQNAFYDETPFSHFNRTGNALQILYDNGWKFVSEKATKIWLTKPGGKNKQVHAAFFTDRNLFYCFTTSTDFQSEKSYTQSEILWHLECNEDWQKVYAWLTQKGYGIIKEKIESYIIKTGKELPPNASESAKQKKQQHEQQQQAVHPFGIFWEFDDKDKLKISRERLYFVASELGFKIYRNELVRIIAPFVHQQTQRQFFDTCKEYIHIEDGDLYEDICNTYEAFLQDSGKFTASRLPELDPALLTEDTRAECNKFYLNKFLTITSQNISEHNYDDLQKLVLHSRIQQRDFFKLPGGVYPQFLEYALDGISENIQQIIGYLAHEYKDETTGYIIVLIEKVADPKQGGGSGKNLFAQLLSHTTTFISRPGAGAKFDEKFFQSWSGQKIFAINDVDDSFNFLFLKDPAAGNMLWKKLFKDEVSISPKDTPKLIVNTNYSYDVSDGGLMRRIKPLEFTDFFTKEGGVDIVFNKHFTDDWTKEDWNGYDTFIAESIQKWLQSNRKLQTQSLSDTTWEKQFIQNHKPTIWDIIMEYWDKWMRMKDVPNDVFKMHLSSFYSENDIPQKYQPSIKNINKALYDYAAKKRILLYMNISMRQSNLIEGKGRRFLSRDEAPF